MNHASDSTVLLTGTGTVGSEVLLALARRAPNRVAVLIRARGKKSATTRAEALFATLGLTDDERARVEVVEGDVAAPDLGLDATMSARLARSVDRIVHTAAATSLAADAELCESANALGTRNAVAFAERAARDGRLRRFLHVSTAFVAGDADGVILEDGLVPDVRHANAYEASKYAAEAAVRDACARGLDAAIVRPGMVVGAAATGRTRAFDVVYPLLRLMACGHLTVFPADPSAPVHLAPIDHVVDTILAASEAEWACGRTFHATGRDPITAGELFSSDGFFPPGVARPRLVENIQAADVETRERDLLDSLAFALPYFRSRAAFDTTNAARLGPVPAADAAFVDRLGRFASEAGYHRVAAVV